MGRKARTLTTISGIIPKGTYMPVIKPDSVCTNVEIPLKALLVRAKLVAKKRKAVVENEFKNINPRALTAKVIDIRVPPVSTSIILITKVIILKGNYILADMI